MVSPHASTHKKGRKWFSFTPGAGSSAWRELGLGTSLGTGARGHPALFLPSSGGSRTGTTTLLRALGSWGCVFPLSKEDLVGRRLVKPWRD